MHPDQGYQTHNLGTCPSRELNPQSSGGGEDSPSNWATRPGPNLIFYQQIKLKNLSLNLKGDTNESK